MLTKVFLALIGLASGIAVSAGIFAFVISLGFIERMADLTRTAPYIKLYENIILIGAVCGNILTVYQANIHLGVAGTAVFGLFGGVFTGILSIALVEILKAIPILLRRVNLHKGLGFLVLALALGKMTGSLIQFIQGWTA